MHADGISLIKSHGRRSADSSLGYKLPPARYGGGLVIQEVLPWATRLPLRVGFKIRGRGGTDDEFLFALDPDGFAAKELDFGAAVDDYAVLPLDEKLTMWPLYQGGTEGQGFFAGIVPTWLRRQRLLFVPDLERGFRSPDI